MAAFQTEKQLTRSTHSHDGRTALTDRAVQGVVYRKSQGQYAVMVDGATMECSLSNRLRKDLIYPIADPSSIRRHVVEVADIKAVDPVAIGDQVGILPAGDGSGMIVEVAPRKNKLSRRAAGTRPLEQVIVANADQFVPVIAAARPHPSWELLDRYLAAAEEAEMASLIVITKLDLANREEIEAHAHAFRDLGYRVLLTSATAGEGIDELRQELAGRMSVVAGKSGVGKTSLLNAVQPGLGLRVAEVGRGTNKGRHTTTHLEMFGLDVGGSIVDTPGMREFGLWNTDAFGLANLLVEFRPLLGRCRFGLDCGHRHEPGCAIQAAVVEGHITERRYRSYLRMADSL